MTLDANRTIHIKVALETEGTMSYKKYPKLLQFQINLNQSACKPQSFRKWQMLTSVVDGYPMSHKYLLAKPFKN